MKSQTTDKILNVVCALCYLFLSWIFLDKALVYFILADTQKSALLFIGTAFWFYFFTKKTNKILG